MSSDSRIAFFEIFYLELNFVDGRWSDEENNGFVGGDGWVGDDRFDVCSVFL